MGGDGGWVIVKLVEQDGWRWRVGDCEASPAGWVALCRWRVGDCEASRAGWVVDEAAVEMGGLQRARLRTRACRWWMALGKRRRQD